MGGLIDGVVHEDLATDIREGRVQPSRDQDAAVIEADCHGVTLKDQVLWHELLRPVIFGKVILQDHLRVVRISEEVVLCDRLHLVVEEFESVLVGELHDVVLQGTNVFEQLG